MKPRKQLGYLCVLFEVLGKDLINYRICAITNYRVLYLIILKKAVGKWKIDYFAKAVY